MIERAIERALEQKAKRNLARLQPTWAPAAEGQQKKGLASVLQQHCGQGAQWERSWKWSLHPEAEPSCLQESQGRASEWRLGCRVCRAMTSQSKNDWAFSLARAAMLCGLGFVMSWQGLETHCKTFYPWCCAWLAARCHRVDARYAQGKCGKARTRPKKHTAFREAGEEIVIDPKGREATKARRNQEKFNLWRRTGSPRHSCWLSLAKLCCQGPTLVP